MTLAGVWQAHVALAFKLHDAARSTEDAKSNVQIVVSPHLCFPLILPSPAGVVALAGIWQAQMALSFDLNHVAKH